MCSSDWRSVVSIIKSLSAAFASGRWEACLLIACTAALLTMRGSVEEVLVLSRTSSVAVKLLSPRLAITLLKTSGLLSRCRLSVSSCFAVSLLICPKEAAALALSADELESKRVTQRKCTSFRSRVGQCGHGNHSPPFIPDGS